MGGKRLLRKKKISVQRDVQKKQRMAGTADVANQLLKA